MNAIDNSKICFLIPTYDRYDKLLTVLDSIKIFNGVNAIIFNDGSDDIRYKNLDEQYPEFKFIHNPINNGKIGYNQTVKTLFNEGIKSEYDYFIYYADDMVFCDNFIEHIKPFFYENKIVNIFSINDNGWGCSGYIDGFFTISKDSLKFMVKLIPPILVDIEGRSTGVWKAITRYFCGNNNINYTLSLLNYSLCQHNGNDDSKLHPKFRLTTNIYADNFYDDFYGEEIKIISESKPSIKKKSSDDIPNGNPAITPIENFKKPIEKKPINNSQITPRPVKLHKPEKQNTISRIPNDITLGKLRKGNLKFGKR